MPDTATLQKRLAQAEEARHRLMTGAQRVQVSFADHDVRFVEQSNVAQLDAYIAELRRALGQPVNVRRPIRPLFGS